jgi:hypothetical protein
MIFEIVFLPIFLALCVIACFFTELHVANGDEISITDVTLKQAITIRIQLQS